MWPRPFGRGPVTWCRSPGGAHHDSPRPRAGWSRSACLASTLRPFALLAQWAEQLTLIQRVVGSNPTQGIAGVMEGLAYMQTGTVTRLFELRGFGFITPDACDRDVFLGGKVLSASDMDFHEGQRVEFDAVESDPGLVVVRVRPLQSS